MRSINFLSIISILFLIQVYLSLCAIIPQPPKEKRTPSQEKEQTTTTTITDDDKPQSRQSEDEEEQYKFPTANDYYPEGGEELTGFDKFSHSYFSLIDGLAGKSKTFDHVFARMVKFYEDFLNFVHDKVHVEGKDYHETAYITGLVTEGERAAQIPQNDQKQNEIKTNSI